MRPKNEKSGIDGKLQEVMLDWYFSQTKDPVRLSTDPGTRAEGFYLKSGWRNAGMAEKGEIRFEMRYQDWLMYRS